MARISKAVDNRSQYRNAARVFTLLKVVLSLAIIAFGMLALGFNNSLGFELVNSPAGLWFLMFIAISIFVAGAWLLPLAAPIEPFLKQHYEGRNFEKMARRDLWIGSTLLPAGFAMAVIVSFDFVPTNALTSLTVGGSAILGSIFLTRWYHESQVALDEAS
tara:strand:- start:55 stop:537 length:483 start_codon:yes stop_codon:yes gene_type:complete